MGSAAALAVRETPGGVADLSALPAQPEQQQQSTTWNEL